MDLDQLTAGKKHVRLIGVSYPICRTRRSGIFSILCGAGGPFPAAAAMLMWVIGAYVGANPTYK